MENITINETSLYVFIQNLKINSDFSYENADGNIKIKIQESETNFQNPNNSEIITRLLNEKFLKALNKSEYSSIVFATVQKTYAIKCSNQSAQCILGLDEQNNLTEQSKVIIDSIVGKEFESWKQTFHVIPKPDFGQFTVYYDNKKMIINNAIFEYIKSVLEKNEKSFNDLLDVNPFRRMIK